MFETDISQVAILMVDRDLMYKKFLIKENEFKHYTNLWKQKLLKFHNTFSWWNILFLNINWRSDTHVSISETLITKNRFNFFKVAVH